MISDEDLINGFIAAFDENQNNYENYCSKQKRLSLVCFPWRA